MAPFRCFKPWPTVFILSTHTLYPVCSFSTHPTSAVKARTTQTASGDYIGGDDGGNRRRSIVDTNNQSNNGESDSKSSRAVVSLTDRTRVFTLTKTSFLPVAPTKYVRIRPGVATRKGRLIRTFEVQTATGMAYGGGGGGGGEGGGGVGR